MVENAKTLKELEKMVIDGQMGLQSVEDLEALFRDTAPQPVVPATAPPVEPPTTQTGQAPAQQAAPPAAQAGEGEPKIDDVLGLVPEKFRDKDVRSSVEKMGKSYTELEQQFQKQQEEVARLKEFVDSYMAPKRPDAPMTQQPIPRVGAPIGEESQSFEDVDYLERPGEVIPKVAEAVAKKLVDQGIQNFYQYLIVEAQRQKILGDFKQAHPDMDTYVKDMQDIVAERPDLNKSLDSMPLVYEMAKRRYQKRIDDMKSQLGLQQSTPGAAPTNQPTANVDVKAQLRQALKELVEENQKRKAASGIVGGSATTTPGQRTDDTLREKPMTEEEQIFEAMMKSGPKSLSFGQ